MTTDTTTQLTPTERLFDAAATGDIGAIRAAVADGADPQADRACAGWSRSTAVSTAAREGHLNAVSYLVSLGARLDASALWACYYARGLARRAPTRPAQLECALYLYAANAPTASTGFGTLDGRWLRALERLAARRAKADRATTQAVNKPS